MRAGTLYSSAESSRYAEPRPDDWPYDNLYENRSL